MCNESGPWVTTFQQYLSREVPHDPKTSSSLPAPFLVRKPGMGADFVNIVHISGVLSGRQEDDNRKTGEQACHEASHSA
jgi:hypothetical protein